MKTVFNISVISTLIRGFSMISRFGLIILLGKFMSTSDFGLYGLIQSSLAIGIYIIGLDLYVYTNREIPKCDLNDQKTIIKSQYFIHIITYITIIPILLFLLSSNFISIELIPKFAALLIFEHLSFEIIRFLTSLQKPIMANIIFLFRSIVWIIPFVIISYLNNRMFNLNILINFWIFGLFISLIIGIIFLYKINLFPFKNIKIDYSFILKALKGSSIFLLASVLNKISFYSSRYFLKYLRTPIDVAIISFYQNILQIIEIFIYTSIVMILLPKIIKNKNKGLHNTYTRNVNIFYSAIFWLTIIFIILLFIFIKPFLVFIGKDVLITNIRIFYLLGIGFLLLNIFQIFHYNLYINQKDTIILKASIFGFILNIISSYLLIIHYGLYGSCIAFVLTVIIIGIFELIFVDKKEIFNKSIVLSVPKYVYKIIFNK
jgi:O-antigen/teichoic acid export membrane protein